MPLHVFPVILPVFFQQSSLCRQHVDLKNTKVVLTRLTIARCVVYGPIYGIMGKYKAHVHDNKHLANVLPTKGAAVAGPRAGLAIHASFIPGFVTINRLVPKSCDFAPLHATTQQTDYHIVFGVAFCTHALPLFLLLRWKIICLRSQQMIRCSTWAEQHLFGEHWCALCR